jgi:hypothetical protein
LLSIKLLQIKKSKLMKKTILLILGCSLIFTACKKNNSIPAIPGCMDQLAANYNPLATIDDSSCIYSPTELQLFIFFTQTIDGVNLTQTNMINNSMMYINDAGESYSIQTLKYLISDITLHAADGSKVTLQSVHFVDVLDDIGTSFGDAWAIDPGHYTSISYTMGLDTTMNKTNQFLNEDFHASMAWPVPMGGGYHYMRLEGAYINDSTLYNTHTGGTMGNDYSFTHHSPISLIVDPYSFTDGGQITINMEISNWYRTPNTISLAGSIMGDMMKQMQLKENGMTDVFSVSINQ